MVKLINKNGMEIHNSAKHVFEELMRGTGCVMADKSSIFLESESFNEKYIVVSKVAEPQGPVTDKKFASSQFKEAWEVFNNWPEGI
jgi:hypothetical protein